MCIARFEEAYGRDSAVPPSRGPEELEDVPDELIQNDSESAPSIRPHDPLDDDLVEECPPPSDEGSTECQWNGPMWKQFFSTPPCLGSIFPCRCYVSG